MSTIMPKSLDNVKQSARAGPGDEVFDALHDVMHLYRGQRQRALDASGAPGSGMEAKALGFFARHPGATLSDLAEHSGRDKSQLARLIAGLRERGMLDARTDAGDRRNVRLFLSPRAEEAHQEMQKHLRKVAREAIADISEAECRQLVRLLSRIRAKLVAVRERRDSST